MECRKETCKGLRLAKPKHGVNAAADAFKEMFEAKRSETAGSIQISATASWVKISSSTLDVSSLLKTYKEAVLEIRYRYTAKNSSSKPVTVRIYNL